MSAELYPDAAPGSVAFVLAHLLPICPTPRHLGMKRKEGGPLPFRLVNLVYEVDNTVNGLSVATVSVHTLAEGVDGEDPDTTADREGRITHRRMQVLENDPTADVNMSGVIANCDYLKTIEKPALRDYGDDRISRVKAVYELGLSFVTVA